MRSEGNPLDLNNLPEDNSRDGKLTSEDSSSSAVYRKKKSGGKDRKDDAGKVYECRFCSLKFCKSQALGGHMNRHRQERETETLNKARQLVFTNDLAPPPHLGYVSGGGSTIDPTMSFRPVCPTRLFSTSSPLISPHPPPPSSQSQVAQYMYTSQRMQPFHSQYPAPPPVNDYIMGNVVTNSSYGVVSTEGGYTCIGAPAGHGFPSSGSSGGVRDVSLHNQEEGLKWGRR